MKKTICDECGKEVNIFDHPAIHGWLELYQQYDKTARLEWWKCGSIFGREKRIDDEGAWCDFDCLAKYLAKRLNRKFDGSYPSE